jgi:hypothetical protein
VGGGGDGAGRFAKWSWGTWLGLWRTRDGPKALLKVLLALTMHLGLLWTAWAALKNRSSLRYFYFLHSSVSAFVEGLDACGPQPQLVEALKPVLVDGIAASL